jgi:hypothetical protein
MVKKLGWRGLRLGFGVTLATGNAFWQSAASMLSDKRQAIGSANLAPDERDLASLWRFTAGRSAGVAWNSLP